MCEINSSTYAIHEEPVQVAVVLQVGQAKLDHFLGQPFVTLQQLDVFEVPEDWHGELGWQSGNVRAESGVRLDVLHVHVKHQDQLVTREDIIEEKRL